MLAIRTSNFHHAAGWYLKDLGPLSEHEIIKGVEVNEDGFVDLAAGWLHKSVRDVAKELGSLLRIQQ